MQALEGRVAIITGAAGGQGRAEAAAFAAAGAIVVADDLRDDLVAACAGIDGEIVCRRHDVTREDDWQHIVGVCLERWGMANGAVDFAILDPVMALAQQKAGKLRVLAISTSNRTRATGDLPTFGEQGVRVDLAGWWAALVPAGTPDAIVQTINNWFADVLAEEDTNAFLANNGADALSVPAAQANRFFLQEIKTLGELIEMARIEKQ